MDIKRGSVEQICVFIAIYEHVLTLTPILLLNHWPENVTK